MNSFDFFVIFIFPPIILIVGLSGNLIALLVLIREKLKKIGTRHIFIYLFLSDTVYLLQLIINYLGYGFGLDLSTISSLSCQIYVYFNYSLGAISPWLLIYISLEKFVSIKWPDHRLILKNKLYQKFFFLLVLIFNLLYYLPIPFFYTLIEYKTNKTDYLTKYGCEFKDYRSQKITSYMDLINRGTVPILLMIVLSIMLIYYIKTSSKRVISDFNHKENKIHNRNIRFSITSVYINIFYMALNLPLLIDIFIPNYYESIEFLFFFYLYYLSYAFNFYIILVTNRFFRKQSKILFLQILKNFKFNS